ncbi:MAG: N-acetylmuramoyl-L-alanine amidase [Fusobacteriota bacterium]
MKKTLMILMVLIGIIINAKDLSEVLDIKLGKNSVIFNIDDKGIEKPLITYDDENRLIFIEFQDTKLNSNLKNMNINGNYIKNIQMINFENVTDFFIKLNKNVEFKDQFLENPRRLVLNLSYGDDRKRIVIDPGHGGKDPGAVGYRNLYEKDIVLNMAKDLKEKLDDRYDVLLTRDKDVFIPLGSRSKIANDYKADLFISIHLNANRSSRASGVETFYYSRRSSDYAKQVAEFENKVDEEFGITNDYAELIVNDISYSMNQERSVKIARNIEDNLAKKTKFKSRGIYGANFSVLRGTKAPAVLIEAGFISNVNEAKKLATRWYQKRIATGISEEIDKYFN